MDEIDLDVANRTQHDEEDDRRRDELAEEGVDGGRVIPWTEFTEDFHMSIPDFNTVRGTCEANMDKLIDLRPYA